MSSADLRAKQAKHPRGDGASGSILRIVLVTREPLYREGVQLAFREAGSLILAEGDTIADAALLANSGLADMLVIEANSIRGAVEMARTLGGPCPRELPIVAVSESASVDEIRHAFDAGIRGCVLKRVEGAEFVRILEGVGRGSCYVPPEVEAALLRQSVRSDAAKKGELRPYRLTAREEQILDCVARALTNKEVARELQISEKTVKHYMTVIMEKLQVRNRVEAVLKVKRNH